MIIDFTITLGKAIIIQLGGVLGIFFLFGFVLDKLQHWTHGNYYRSIGWRGILWTAWFGTPIHEFSHIIFAKLFRHKIHSISLFEPNHVTGNLGHVDHSYNQRSLWQQIGNFFIGAAPMIFGSIFLVVMLYFLVPNGKEIFSPLTNQQGSFLSFFYSLKITLFKLFSIENIYKWNFWLFLYLSFCIVSHISPSKEDRRSMWKGLIWLILVLIISNIIAMALKINLTSYILQINIYIGLVTGIFIYATTISLIHLLLSTIILRPFSK